MSIRADSLAAHGAEGRNGGDVRLGEFQGNLESPTFHPSFKHSGLRIVHDAKGKWTGEWVRDGKGNPVKFVCHYNLTKGMLQFHGDSTHAMAGKTIALPPLPAFLCDESDG